MSAIGEGPDTHAHRLSVVTVGQALSLFLVFSFLFCIALGLVSTRAELHNAWFAVLPGVTWLSWKSVMLGIVETAAYGWYIAVAFVPLYNWAARRRATSTVGLALLAPLFLGACMMSGIGGMGMHGAVGTHELSPASSMSGPTTIKEFVAQGTRITASFPSYAVGDALAYEVSLRDLRDETLIRDATVSLVVTPDGATRLAPGMSDSGTYVFRPALTAEGAYRLVVVVERIGTMALDPPVKVEHTVQLWKPMQMGGGDGHRPAASRVTPVIVLGALAMAVMMAFAFR